MNESAPARRRLRRATYAAVALVALTVSGCKITLKEKHVDRIVKRVMAARKTSKPYFMRARMTGTHGTQPFDHTYTMSRYGQEIYTTHRNGMKYWSTRGGAVVVRPGGKSAQVFKGIRQPTDDQFRSAARRAVQWWLSFNDVTIELSTEEGGWGGNLLRSSPRKWRPLVYRTETFFESDTAAPVLYREFDESDNVVRLMKAVFVFRISKDDFRIAEPDEGCAMTVFDASPEAGPLPDWALPIDNVLSVLSSPRTGSGDGIAALDFTNGGAILVHFQRRAPDHVLTSPISRQFSIDDCTVRYWWVGERIVVRWVRNGIEHTLFTNLPPDVFYEHVRASIADGVRPGGAKGGYHGRS